MVTPTNNNTLGPSPCLEDLISSYGILSSLAPWLSTLDLYHLGTTNRSLHSYTLESPSIFKVLSRQCLCDGRGLARRQQFRDPYGADYHPTNYKSDYPDEEIEVRVYNIKCNEAEALPCIKCGINICEECRCYPRAEPLTMYANRRPHLRDDNDIGDIMCLCPACHAVTEKALAGEFLNELCDCDRYTQWICTSCRLDEERFVKLYFEEHTKWEVDWEHGYDEWPPTKTMGDYVYFRAFWCQCGTTLAESTQPRCTWCKRRHRPEDEWHDEWEETGDRLFFDNSPDYPIWVTDDNDEYPNPYPRLGYLRPGDEDTEAS